MKYYILFIGILTIVGLIKLHKLYLKNEINKQLLRIAIKSKIKDIISDAENLKIPFYLFSISKDYYVQQIFDHIIQNIKTNGLTYFNYTRHIYINKSSLSKLIMDELSHPIILDLLQKQYLKCIKDNIEEAQRLEDKAIEYNNTFGNEPEGDPVLHPVEKNKESRLDLKYQTITELEQIGIVEDIDN